MIKKLKSTIAGPTNVTLYKPKKGEKYMNEKQLEHFRDVLIDWKKHLLEEMERTSKDLQTEVAADPIDRASQEENFNLELKAKDRVRKLIKKIDESLEKIQGGDYGYCVDCGAEIGLERLDARPTATQCIECKIIAEIKEKQIGG